MSTLEIPTPQPPSSFVGMKMPIPKPGSIELPRTERRRRAAAGSTSRLTKAMITKVENAIAVGTTLPLIADMLGVRRKTFFGWLRRGALADERKWRERDQLDRLCLELAIAVDKAQGELAVRLIGVQAQAGGLTRERPTETRTRRIIKGATVKADGTIEGGTEVEVIIETIEKAPDWKAAQALTAMRFPDDLGSGPMEDETTGSIVTNEQLRARLDALRRPTEDDDEGDDEDVFDAELVDEVPEPAPAKRAAKTRKAAAKKPR